ncbi:putative receptor-like protein kinase At3g47110 [Hevea brasiliensis]|uniref:putative receptor-like protein kinase At3g47110 n=1 Tax=Hevea brasiliensis TaxID=3981 RepID=UPI0025D154C9|nr:putative receptor-like protein kinase At3g47110 [Hevea brasiliensis]
MSRNNLSGSITEDVLNLPSLSIYLNLSQNSLTGNLLTDMGRLINLNTTDVSENMLSGEIPESIGSCLSLEYLYMQGNFFQGIIPSSLASLKASALAYRWRVTKKKSSAASIETDHLVKVSYKELYDATGGFSTHNLIGSGSFGSVYKGFLKRMEGPMAIKNEFKALIYEFIGKGSLDKWLHHTHRNYKSRRLNFLQRLNIAIDVASALHYIHDLCEIPIIHCDLKPSNVLLDVDMVKLFSNTDDASQEDGIGGTASKEGDVYCYGILVLEMFSGKRPTNKIFEDRLALHEFVKDALPERLELITDPTILSRGMEETPITNAQIDKQVEIHADAESSSNGNLSRTIIA